MKSGTDQLGTTHFFAEVPQRIVSLVPSQTELLVDLGLENKIVGITKFCVHPFYLKATKTIVGGTKKVNFDTIKALKPDIIIANKEENTLEIVTELATICPVWVTDIHTIAENNDMIFQLGQVFNQRTQAQKWIDKIHAAHADFLQFVAPIASQKVAYFIWGKPYMAAGSPTFINHLLMLNKWENIYTNKESRYPEIELKKIRLEGDPDIVFLSSEPFPFKDEHAFEIGRCTHHAKTVFVDGEMFSWYGSRLFQAFEYFKKVHQKIG